MEYKIYGKPMVMMKSDSDIIDISNSNDYIASGEITVAITLHEYRDLIADRAEYRIKYEHEKERADKAEHELTVERLANAFIDTMQKSAEGKDDD